MGKDWLGQKLADVVDAIAETGLEFEPGSKWQYSDAGYTTLGRIAEVVSGQPYDVFVTDRIFKPLGMSRSFYKVPKMAAGRVANIYDRNNDTLSLLYRHDPDFEIVNTFPAAGIFSTPGDFAIFFQMFLNGGTYNGQRILAPATVRMMIADQTPGVARRWGLGWAAGFPQVRGTHTPVSTAVFAHGGATGTFGWADTEQDLVGLVFLQTRDRSEPGNDVHTPLLPHGLRGAGRAGRPNAVTAADLRRERDQPRIHDRTERRPQA